MNILNNFPRTLDSVGSALKSACITALLLLLGTAAAHSAPSSGGYLPAALCGECHEETFDSWSRTIHALAAIDPIFIEAMSRAEQSGGGSTRRLCLTCHSPTTVRSGDDALESAISREGVTCSFCHSLTGVDLDQPVERFSNNPERLREALESGRGSHHFEDHRIMMGADFCAGCHEWTNSLGLRILGTYSEWQESFYAGEQITCQQCHMPKSLGGETETEGTKSLRASNLHFQMGGHSQDQLVVAAEMTLEAEAEAGAVAVEVEITNQKAGHKLPTGIPARKMKLVVEVFDRNGLQVDSRTQTYSRVIVDSEGKVLQDVTDQFLLGARELSDNRIAPKETRRERFEFPRPDGVDFLLVEASLEYEILTPYLNPPLLSFGVDKKRVAVSLKEKGTAADFSSAAALAIIAAVFGFVTAGTLSLLRRRHGSGGRPDGKE